MKKDFLTMDRVESSETDLDLDVDLESGNATSEEDISVCHNSNCENSKNSHRDGGVCSCSCSKFLVSDKGKRNNVDKIMGNEEREKRKPERPSKPPRPPKGPALDASDMKLLKEISELNLKRKKMEKIRTLRRIKKEKGSSTSGNLIAFLVTIVFFMVVIFQGLLGSRSEMYR